MKVHTYKIIDGPTMHEVLGDMLDGHETKLLTDNGCIVVMVNVIEREDGSGKSFNIKGNVSNVNKDNVKFYVQTNGVGGEITSVTG